MFSMGGRVSEVVARGTSTRKDDKEGSNGTTSSPAASPGGGGWGLPRFDHLRTALLQSSLAGGGGSAQPRLSPLLSYFGRGPAEHGAESNKALNGRSIKRQAPLSRSASAAAAAAAAAVAAAVPGRVPLRAAGADGGAGGAAAGADPSVVDPGLPDGHPYATSAIWAIPAQPLFFAVEEGGASGAKGLAADLVRALNGGGSGAGANKKKSAAARQRRVFDD